MWTILESAIYVGLAICFLVLLWRLGRRQEKTERSRYALEAMAVLAAVWVLALGVIVRLVGNEWWIILWRRTAQTGLVILALVTAEFARAFAMRPYRWSWRALVAVLLISAALSLDLFPSVVSTYLPPLPALWPGETLPAGLVLLVAWLLFTGMAWWTGLQALRQATGPQHRNRIRYLLLALAFLLAGDAVVWVVTIGPTAWSRSGVTWAALCLRLVGLSVLTFTLLHHELPDMLHFARRGVRFVLISGMVLAALVGSVLLAGSAVSGWDAALAEARAVAPGLGLGAVLAVFVIPRVRKILERTLLHRDYDLQQELRRYSQEINLVFDMGRLAEATLGWVEQALHVKASAFILLTPRERDGVELDINCAREVPLLPPMAFAADSLFLFHFQHSGRPLSQYDLDMLPWFKNLDGAERDWLRRLGVDLYVPVLVAGQPVALLALGPKSNRLPYTKEDLESLMILAGQAGTALDNARLVDDLRHVQDDLQNLGSQLTETNRQLQRMDQAKTDFVAIAAHELRTPLSQIYGYSDVLTSMKGDELSDGQMLTQFIDGISRGAMRLKRVIDALIDMSLIESGSLTLQLVQVPLPLLVKNAVDSVRPAADERKLSLRLSDMSRLPYIEADSVRLEQALVALLSNAIKYTPDGGQVTVSGHYVVQPSAQACVELLIADTGIGIDRDQQELIFDKFYRGENLLLHSSGDVRFKGAGPGLGLAIARGIVEAHGGKVWVESPGRDEKRCPGSTFHVRMPVKHAKEA